MRAYKSRYLDKIEGGKSTFYYLPSGALYDDFSGGAVRVGNIGHDGTLTIKKKYMAKYGERLRQIVAPKKPKHLKGVEGGNCNRRACQVPGATWYNHSTCAWYCPKCASEINAANRADAFDLLGHDLCTKGREVSA